MLSAFVIHLYKVSLSPQRMKVSIQKGMNVSHDYNLRLTVLWFFFLTQDSPKAGGRWGSKEAVAGGMTEEEAIAAQQRMFAEAKARMNSNTGVSASALQQSGSDPEWRTDVRFCCIVHRLLPPQPNLKCLFVCHWVTTSTAQFWEWRS